MRSDIVPGGIFPRLRIARSHRQSAQAQRLQGDDALILTLARGRYCPKEHQRDLELAAVPPEDRSGVLFRNSVRQSEPSGLSFQTPTKRCKGSRDIQEYTDPEHNPMIPHTLALEPDRVIYSIYNGYWFFGRPTMEDLRRAYAP